MDGVKTLQLLVELTYKWHAPSVRSALWSSLHDQEQAGRGERAWLFRLAARDDQAELCVHFVKYGWADYWVTKEDGKYSDRGGLHRWYVWNPHAWPLLFTQGVPETYIWALARAHGEGPQKGFKERKEMALSFEKYLRAATHGSAL
jgi:hypothetical protein